MDKYKNFIINSQNYTIVTRLDMKNSNKLNLDY